MKNPRVFIHQFLAIEHRDSQCDDDEFWMKSGSIFP